jgi:hypothetical protein
MASSFAPLSLSHELHRAGTPCGVGDTAPKGGPGGAATVPLQEDLRIGEEAPFSTASSSFSFFSAVSFSDFTSWRRRPKELM